MPQESINAEKVAYVATAKIKDNSLQPRQNYNEERIVELSASIQTNGVLQPLLVRSLGEGSFEVIAGERRLKAARVSNLAEVPVIIKEVSDKDAFVLALVENLQRED